MDCDDILTVSEIMELLYVGKNTVYKLLNTGELKGFRIGKAWRVPRECLTDYIVSKCRM